MHGEVKVRFMKLVGDIYVWPETDEVSMVPIYDIARVLPTPSLVTRGRTMGYLFD